MQVRVRDGQRLHVRVVGRGSQPVLLLHGLGMKGAHWLPFIWHLRRRCRFYMLDFRGAGGSVSVPLNQDDVFQNHMEDVADIVEALALDNILLVGYSLGATTALHWQNAGGFKRVKAYMHIDQSPCVTNRPDWPHGLFGSQQEWVFARLKRLLPLLQNATASRLEGLPASDRKTLLRDLSDVFSRILGKRFISPVFNVAAEYPSLLSLLLPMTRVADFKAYILSYTRFGRDYLPGLQGCTTPVTVVTGAKSPLYDAAGQRAVADAVVQGHVEVLKRSGHVPLVDQPVAFTRILRRFLLQ